MEGKTCTQCKVNKTLDNFGKHCGRKDGLRSECKACKAQQDKNYKVKYNDELKEKRKAKWQAYTESDEYIAKKEEEQKKLLQNKAKQLEDLKSKKENAIAKRWKEVRMETLYEILKYKGLSKASEYATKYDLTIPDEFIEKVKLHYELLP